MPIARFQMPDGRVARFEVPEGTTPEQAQALIESAIQGSGKKNQEAADRKLYDPTSGMTGTQKLLAGTGKAFADVTRGVGQILGLVSDEEVTEAKKRDQALMSTGAGAAGNILGNVAIAAPTAFIPGANTLTGAALTGAFLGATQPVAEGESRLRNTAIGGAGGAAGQAVANTVGRAVRPVQTTLDPIAGDLANKARGMGIPLNNAQSTRSRGLWSARRGRVQGGSPMQGPLCTALRNDHED